MSLINKIFTAIRGGAREVGESIVDKNSIRIFEQEIADANDALEKAKRDLTSVMAKEMQAARKLETLNTDITKHEGFVAKAREKDDEALALEVASKIADLQSDANVQETARASYSNHVVRLKDLIKKTGKALNDMERQLVMVKTTDSVQKATSAITENYATGTSKLLTAKESLDRVKQKQQDLEDRLVAGNSLQQELDGGDLDARLKEAGIVEDDNAAADILAKLKAKNSKK
jgi:phage shock protein A